MDARQAFDLYKAGRMAEAAALCERLVTQDSGSVAAWHLLGASRLALGRLPDALAALEQARSLDPGRAGVLSALAAALVGLERFEEGLTACDAALDVDPENPVVLGACGVALRRLGRPAEALAAHDAALAVSPGFIDALCNRGLALSDLGRFDEALAAHDQACAAAPDDPRPLANRAALLTLLNRPVEAGRDLERVLVLDPPRPRLLGDLLHVRRLACDWRDDAALLRAVRAELQAGRPAISPFAALSAFDEPALHRTCAALAAPPAASAPRWPVRPSGGRLRVAYLSADLHDHATARLMAGLIEAHDRHRFEIIALSYGPDLGGPLRSRLDVAFARRIDVRGLSDAAVATLARDLGVDIAVDLKGYTQEGRPGIQANRAAPIQVSWLGYPGTLGAPYVDYVIADPVVAPPRAEADYDEAVVRLPLYQPNDWLSSTPPVPDRGTTDLPDGAMVFCCFNNPGKITPEVFAVWTQILRAVPDAVLWLYAGAPGVVETLRAQAGTAGIDRRRLIFAGPVPHGEHLARHALADLVLDTWPYGAHTTASDALRMGVPVLTLPGESFASRVGASLLTALDLPDLIAPDSTAYVETAVRLARDRTALSETRRRLGVAVAASAVFNPARFARTLEAAFETMHARHVQGLAPAGFAIGAAAAS